MQKYPWNPRNPWLFSVKNAHTQKQKCKFILDECLLALEFTLDICLLDFLSGVGDQKSSKTCPERSRMDQPHSCPKSPLIITVTPLTFNFSHFSSLFPCFLRQNMIKYTYISQSANENRRYTTKNRHFQFAFFTNCSQSKVTGPAGPVN